MASNLVWLAITLVILGFTYRSIRRVNGKLGIASAMTLALLIGLILLPVISISDDLIEAKQTALPLSGQTWRLVSEGAAVGLDTLPVVGAFLVLLLSFLVLETGAAVSQWKIRPFAARLTRSQRLRPPPAFAY